MSDEFTFPRNAARDPDRSLPADHPAATLRRVCVEYDDGPDRCTIYPHDVDRPALVTTWLTADRGAFVDLTEAR